MSKTEKLLAKLQNGSISAAEARTLMKKMGWELIGGKGSHEVWEKSGNSVTISPHGKDLKSYQIKQIQKAMEAK